MSANTTRRLPRVKSLALGLLIGGFFVWMAAKDADLRGVGNVLSTQLHWGFGFAALMFYCLYFVLKSFRWQHLLTPLTQTSPGLLFPYVMVGYLGNLAMPFQLGEAYRGYLLSRDLSINTVSVLSSIFLEKLLDLLVVCSILLIALHMLSIKIPMLEPFRYGFLGMASICLLLFVFIIKKPQQAMSLVRYVLNRLPTNVVLDRLRTLLKHGIQGLAILSSGRRTLNVLLISLLSWFAMLATLYCCLMAVSMSASMTMAAIMLSFTVLGLTLPTSPGFVGTIQIAFVTGAQLFDANHEYALAASILYNLVITVPPMLIGIVCLIVLHRRREVY